MAGRGADELGESGPVGDAHREQSRSCRKVSVDTVWVVARVKRGVCYVGNMSRIFVSYRAFVLCLVLFVHTAVSVMLSDPSIDTIFSFFCALLYAYTLSFHDVLFI